MRNAQGFGYNGHLIFVTPRPTPDGKFTSTFSVSRLNADEPKRAAQVHQETQPGDHHASTEEQAIKDGELRARAWIDANPAE